MIKIQNISKSYESVKALKDITISIGKSELFGVIGPDGAGKTTLFRLIATLLLPNEGTITISGLDSVKDYKKIRPTLGYMPGRFSLYPDLTVEENLTFYATIFGTTIKENYDLIKDIYIQIEPFKKRLAGKLSGGMKQKLALSCALIHKPDVLILDEPTTGVDAVSRKEFWEMLQNLKKENITIIVSTPYMDEARLCDRVALIQKGSLMAVDTPQGIINSFSDKLLSLKSPDLYHLKSAILKSDLAERVYLSGQEIHYIPKDKNLINNDLKDIFKSLGFGEVEIEPAKPTIEDCFMALMTTNDEN